MGIASILDSLGWAILHSTWQGTLLAVAVILFRAATQDRQASLRCGFQVLCLGTALIAFLGTFTFYQVQTLGTSSSTFIDSIQTLGTGAAATPVSAVTPDNLAGPALSPASLEFLTPWVGMIWILGFSLLSLKYTAALVMTQRLRTRGLSDVPANWQRRFRVLTLNSGIHRRVELFISNRVNGPITLGFFKPVVLVPASFFTGLPAEQVEAILLHEIAHIRRHDYLINLIQTAIRTVFFYHPAIYFISKKIDDDRERACDDFAVAQTKDPQALARGLAALRLSLSPRPFALAAAGKRSPLMDRLNRLVGAQDSRRRPDHAVTSLAALIVAAGLIANYSPLANAHPEPADARFDGHPNGELANYSFEEITLNDRTFTAKIAPDGSRWINVSGSWHDVDRNPDLVAELPAIPEAPEAPEQSSLPSFSKFKSHLAQYKVDLDYYIASLEHQIEKGNKGVDLAPQLSRAVEERESMKIETSAIAPGFFDVALAENNLDPIPDIAPLDISKPSVLVAAHELAGGPDLKPGLYIDGNRVNHEEWPEELEEKLENIMEEFEHKMELIEDQFDDAMSDYENEFENFDDYSEDIEARIARANEAVAKAAISANTARDALTREFDNNIEAILADADQYAAKSMDVAQKAIDQAMKDVQRDLEQIKKERHEDHHEMEAELRETLRELREDRAELMAETRESRQIIRRELSEAQREAERARAESLRDMNEWQREINESTRRALREAETERKDAMREAAREQKNAERWQAKEQSHVQSDLIEYREELLEQLKSDGLISQSANAVTITYPGKKMHVNGTPVASDLEDNYCELNEEFHIHKSNNAKIDVTPKGVTLENSYFKYGQTYKTQWTYSD